jgi:hypothetical protein
MEFIELAETCKLVQVSNFLPTRSHELGRKSQKLGRNSEEFVPKLADTPQTWQKNKNLAERATTWQKLKKMLHLNG